MVLPTQFPQKLQRTKQVLTYEPFTFGKWQIAASYKKSPDPMGGSHLMPECQADGGKGDKVMDMRVTTIWPNI